MIKKTKTHCLFNLVFDLEKYCFLFLLVIILERLFSYDMLLQLGGET